MGSRGMECEGCESRLAAALKRVDGVGEASADHSAGTVRVLFDPAKVDEDHPENGSRCAGTHLAERRGRPMSGFIP